MFKYTTVFAVIAGLVFALAPAAETHAAVTQAEFDTWAQSMHEPYRLMIFTSADAAVYSSTTLDDVNSFVDDDANAGLASELGATWACVMASETADINAPENTGTLLSAGDHNVPIYNLGGDLLADDNEALWSGGNLAATNGVEYDSAGATPGNLEVLTACSSTGGISDQSIGNSQRTRGWAASQSGWLSAGVIGTVSSQTALNYPTFGISSVIPEPATMALLAFGGLGLLIRRRRRA